MERKLKIPEFVASTIAGTALVFTGAVACNSDEERCFTYSAVYDPTPKSDNLVGDEFRIKKDICVPKDQPIEKNSCPPTATEIDGYSQGKFFLGTAYLVPGTCVIDDPLDLQPTKA